MSAVKSFNTIIKTAVYSYLNLKAGLYIVVISLSTRYGLNRTENGHQTEICV